MTAGPIEPAAIELSADHVELRCTGDWTLAGIAALESQVDSLAQQAAQQATLNGSSIGAMDSAGALLFQALINQFTCLGKKLNITGVSQKYHTLLKLVAAESEALAKHPLPTHKMHNILYIIGKLFYDKAMVGVNLLTFTGEVAVAFYHTITHPRRIPWRSILRGIDDGGYRGLAIVALLTFLIGIVLTYEIAAELQSYGAGIYIVDLAGLVIMREFSPLITAIIAAGRTGTSYAAEIGTMKVNQEVDALRTMGISPVERLAVPKIIAMLIALPLLTVWADLFGIFGSMLMSKAQLGIGYWAYIDRFQQMVSVDNFLFGILKAPVFAIIIASVGCFQGFQVVGTADDVGRKTTHAAVQAIFLTIIVDAIFSLLSWD